MRTKLTLVFLSLMFFFPGLTHAQNDSTKVKLLWGGNVALGIGVNSGNLGEYFNNPFLVPITFDMVYKDLIVQLNLDAAFGKVTKTMNFDDGTSWNDGDKAFYNAIGVNLGYSIINNNKIKIAPTVGYAFAYISKKWWGSSDISHNEPSTNYLNVALFADYKFKKMSRNGAERYDGYKGIRFTAGAYLTMGDSKPYPEYYNGTMVYFSVGVPVYDLSKKNKAGQ